MSRKNIILYLVAGLTIFTACKKDDDEGNKMTEFDRQAMLSNIANGIILPNYLDLKVKSADLDSKIQAFIAAPTETNLINAQSSFKEAFNSYVKVSVFEFGPAEQVDLDNFLDTFPTDTVKIKSNFTSGNYNLNSLNNFATQGFPALDYLLFAGAGDNAGVVALYSGEDGAARRKYLSDVSARIKTLTDQVYTTWNSSYTNTFISSTGTDVGSSIGLLVNEFNYDIDMLKGTKIGLPIGKMTMGDPYPETVEAYHSKISVRLITTQVSNLKNVFNGGNGLGFDDYLNTLEAKTSANAPLAEAINAKFNDVLKALQSVSDPLQDAILTNKPAVEAVYNQLQSTIVYTKTDMPSALGVSITYQDNDGD